MEPAGERNQQPTEPVDANIETVVKLAHNSTKKQTVTARIGTAITGFFGTMASIILHLLFIGGWCVYNSGWINGTRPFDPYPFNLLTLCVSFEGVLIALFVLLTQNRMARQNELQAQVSLQLQMLVEQEVTRVLQLVRQLCEKEGITTGAPLAHELEKDTDLEHLTQQLEEKFPLT